MTDRAYVEVPVTKLVRGYKIGDTVAGWRLAQIRQDRVVIAGALARRALGRIARARGALSEAQGHLEVAHQAFRSIGAAYEDSRTLLDLAVNGNASSRPDVAATHLAVAQSVISHLKVPFYATRAARLADLQNPLGM